jgi:hypothetical protein
MGNQDTKPADQSGQDDLGYRPGVNQVRDEPIPASHDGTPPGGGAAERALGSFQDAEDALQDTLLTAWPGLARDASRQPGGSAPDSDRLGG